MRLYEMLARSMPKASDDGAPGEPVLSTEAWTAPSYSEYSPDDCPHQSVEPNGDGLKAGRARALRLADAPPMSNRSAIAPRRKLLGDTGPVTPAGPGGGRPP